METHDAPVTAKRARKRRSDAVYADAAARQRAYRARRRAAREAKLTAVVNKWRDERGLPPLRGRPTARAWGLYGNAVKKAKRAKDEEYLAELRDRRGGGVQSGVSGGMASG